MPKISRRDFLERSSKFTLGTLLLSACSAEKQKEKRKSLNFTGQINGEKHLNGHKLRDGILTIPQLKAEEHIYDVIIAGGGISGLVIAQQLQKMGVTDFLLVEKENEVGGLCRGESFGGVPYACGAHYSDYPEPQMLAVNDIYETCGVITGYDNLGWPVVDERFLLKDNKHQLFVEGKWEPHDYPYSIATEEDITELERFEREMKLRSEWRDEKGLRAVGLPLSSISENEEVRALDKLSMMDYLREQGYVSELLYWYCNIWIVDEYGTSIDETSAWAGLQFFKYKIVPPGKYTSTVTFPKGLGYLSEKLVAFLPKDRVLTNNWVININEKAGLNRVVIVDDTNNNYRLLQAKKVVFALPKPQVYHIIPSLRTAGRNEFMGLSYAPWLVANIHLSALPNYDKGGTIKWDNTIYDSWTMGYVNNAHLMEGEVEADKPRVITLYACFDRDVKTGRAELLALGWEHWARVILEELERAHPEIEKLITKMDFWFWGHPMRQPKVETVWGEQRKAMQKPFGNIHFSHVDISGIPVVEEAIDQAWKLSKKLAEDLKP